MMAHTTTGATLLSGSRSPLLQMAEVIARTHHERWDGTGYPEGLKGEQIPLVGRICAICDVFDALASRRSYKDPWAFDRVVREIERKRGSHFDPRVVDAFLKVIDEFRDESWEAPDAPAAVPAAEDAPAARAAGRPAPRPRGRRDRRPGARQPRPRRTRAPRWPGPALERLAVQVQLAGRPPDAVAQRPPHRAHRHQHPPSGLIHPHRVGDLLEAELAVQPRQVRPRRRASRGRPEARGRAPAGVRRAPARDPARGRCA